jgi:vancomycin resistance protein YoaR
METGWSVKRVIRDLVLSRAYQLSGNHDAMNYRVDPENRLCWQMTHRRLDAEAIRDAILHASGELDLRPFDGSVVHGLGDLDFGQNNKDFAARSGAVATHRSVYLPIIRNSVPEALRVFDFAEPSLIVGRSLDVPTTIERLQQTRATSDRTVAFAVEDIVPVVHSGATAEELGITELVSERTTWFYGSTDARKHNIARSAANFFGIVIAPGDEFSFNKYLGSVSESDGYEEGLIIFGGRTIKGVGGGVCQVSTTIYQTAFWAGFPIEERDPHGYMLGYYNDGEGPGMDATVFSPIVDLKFINNTPYHLLLENYYNEELEALTFKFYSTSLGRQVIKEELPWENIVAAPEEDTWEYDPDLPEGEAVQIDWQTDGADVTIHRTVLNANGDILIDQYVVSNYIPYPDVFHYAPGVEPGDFSAVTNKE